MKKPQLWPVIRRVWISAALTATAVFVTWSLVAYRANAEARAAAASEGVVSVDGVWRFTPASDAKTSTLIFFPGSLVDPRAYAPLASSVAAAGYPVLVVELPRRGAFGGAESASLRMRIAAAMSSIPAHHAVVIGGHSRGAVVASSVAARESRLAGLVLIGTSHPRDVDLSGLKMPVTKIVGTRDGLASPEEVEQNAALLPAHTRWIRIEGGNHSQFGWYGFQPLDRRPRIAADEQHAIMISAVLDLLHAIDSNNAQHNAGEFRGQQ